MDQIGFSVQRTTATREETHGEHDSNKDRRFSQIRNARDEEEDCDKKDSRKSRSHEGHRGTQERRSPRNGIGTNHYTLIFLDRGHANPIGAASVFLLRGTT